MLGLMPTARQACLLAAASLFSQASAQTSQQVYSQNFNAAALDTVGTGLGDGSNITDNSGSFNAKVFSSTQWGSGVTPDGQTWRALWLTPMSTGIVGNFFTPVVNQGQSVSAFSANLNLLINYSNRNGETMADGFSVNFGKFNDTTSAYGGEWGMHSPGDGKTGDVLTLGFFTYSASNPRIELLYNGVTVATNAMDPYWNSQNPPPASAFLPVNFSWDANGVDVTYAGTSVFSNVAIAGFTPGIGYRFAMAARTGAAFQNTFVDDIAISTTAAPFVWSAGAGNWSTAGGWTIGAAPTTNNNWIVMRGAGGASNNNAVTAIQGLVFDSASTGSYTLSGNALTIGADGIANNSASAQAVSSNLTLGAALALRATSGALTFSGSIATAGHALTVDAANAVAISGAIGGGGSLTKTGAGTLTLSGANTYAGGTTVSAGTLAGDASSLQGDIANNAAVSFSQASAGTYAGVMSGSGTLAKSGNGALTLTGANTYSGGTTVTAGALRLGHDTALGTGSVTVNGGVISSDSAAARAIANNLVIGGSATLGHAADNGALTFSGSVGLGGASRSLTVDSAVTLSGVVSNGGLTKAGAGRLELSGGGTLAGGLVVSAGTLAVNGPSALSVASASVQAGATLKGSGTIAGDTVVSGIHAPGNSPGVQTFADNLTYNAGSSIVWELVDNTLSGRGTNFDGIDVGGDLSFAGATTLVLVFDLAGSSVDWTDGFWNLTHAGSAGWKVFDVAGTVSNLENLQISATAMLDGNSLSLATGRPFASFSLHQGVDGVYLSYVPEPSFSLFAMAAGGAALLRARRRRSR